MSARNVRQRCKNVRLSTTTMCSLSTKSSPHRTYRRRRPTVVVVVMLLMVLQSAPQGFAVPVPTRPRTSNDDHSDVDDEVALEQLTRVFGLGHVSDHYRQRRRHSDDHTTTRHHLRHRSPPEYMVQLYDTVAYTDGISKTAAPYEADVVRGIPDRGMHPSLFHARKMNQRNFSRN